MSEYWHQRWQDGHTGFHEGQANDLLVQHASVLEWRKPLRLLVPLCAASSRFARCLLRRRNHEGGIFLNAYAYPQEKIDGPPWSVEADEVTRLYGQAKFLAKRSRDTNPSMQAAGVTSIEESAYWIFSGCSRAPR